MKNDEILTLTIRFEDEDGVRVIHPAIIKDERETVLVDCGYPGFLPLLERAALSRSIQFGEITSIVVTHHDYDHYGALHEIREKYPKIRVMASELDAPHIDGRKKSLRLRQADEMRDSIPESDRARAMDFERALEAVKPAAIDDTLRDGDVLPWCGGTEIIATPGHMPGHISLYVRRLKTLITGDAFVVARGRLRMANPNYAMDIDEAKASIKKLARYDIGTFVCYHGGLVKTSLTNRENRRLLM